MINHYQIINRQNINYIIIVKKIVKIYLNKLYKVLID